MQYDDDNKILILMMMMMMMMTTTTTTTTMMMMMMILTINDDDYDHHNSEDGYAFHRENVYYDDGMNHDNDDGIKRGIPFQIPKCWSAIEDELSALLKIVKS